MATKLQPVDVVIVGMGWTGSILAKELSAAGHKVVGLERGQHRVTNPDFQPPHMHDELRFAFHHEMQENLSRESQTFRNFRSQKALPTRRWGAFPLGEGLGGAGVHWNGMSWRYLPWHFQIRSRLVERYGEGIIPEGAIVQDWPITYDELEPYYDKMEYTCGISGQAGNINGERQEGGNFFDPPRKRGYPNPPMQFSYSLDLWTKAAEQLGYHPFPGPSANLSESYINADGINLGGCVYCGFCMLFGCEMNAKASPVATVLKVALYNPNFELRTGCHVNHLNLNQTRDRVNSVTYVDANGQEFEQPAEIVLLCSYALYNVHFMLLSGIGQPYDPVTGEGLVGKHYTFNPVTGGTLFFNDKNFNNFMGAGALFAALDDFNADNFDHTGLGFVEGGFTNSTQMGRGPLQYHPVPPGTPRWGSEWKRAVAKSYNGSMPVAYQMGDIAYPNNYLDLDPTYKDIYGRPLLRITYDYSVNEQRMSSFWVDNVFPNFVKVLNPAAYDVSTLGEHAENTELMNTHNMGGAIMGTNPSNSVLNKYMQCWDVPNLFVVGGNAWPQNPAYNPTITIGAFSFYVADAINNQYMKSPGPLIQA